ncbi:MAG: DUF4301 family protein [Candidatus Binatia bacterium]
MPSPVFSSSDLSDLSARGISPEAAAEQLRIYEEPPPPARLLRPCAPGDGIRCLSEEQASGYAARYEEQARSLAVAKFVPASGAASRMFRALLAALADPAVRERADFDRRATHGDEDAKAVLGFLSGLRNFAFFDDLAGELARRGLDIDAAVTDDVPAVLAALLGADGLSYASLPKGLLVFHRNGAHVRTAFEEHLVEAAAYARGKDDVCRLHFTVSPEHELRFRDLLARVRAHYETLFSVRYEVEFSHQKPSTDTIAAGAEGRPFRDRNGKLLLRPAGHGALIENLGEADGDLFFVKNIDNVAVEALLPLTVLWKRALAGIVLELEADVFSHRRAVEKGGGGAVAAALAFLREHFGTVAPTITGEDALAAFVVDALDRPLRACGMVSSDTNPGGGPFWVADKLGRASAQVVETSQVDRNDPGQKAILESARHFNPVDLVCITRDWKGRPFDLSRFVDHDAVFIAEKSQDGRPLRSIERPGLWNGAMAGWNTVFVEVPAQTFNPVKTINDLLAPAHQGARG